MSFVKRLLPVGRVKNYFRIRLYKRRFNRSFDEIRKALGTEITADDRFRLSEMRDNLIEIKKLKPDAMLLKSLEITYNVAFGLVEESHRRKGEQERKYWQDLKDKGVFEIKEGKKPAVKLSREKQGK